MEWTPEQAAERLAIAKQRLDEGFGEGESVDAARNAFLRWAMSLAPADLTEALAHIATQAQAWEQERAGLVERANDARQYVEELVSQCGFCGGDGVRLGETDGCKNCGYVRKWLAETAGCPTAQEGA